MDQYLDLDYWYSLIAGILPDLLLAILTLIVGLWIISWVSKIFRKSLEKRATDPSLVSFLTSIVSIGLKVLLFISIAGMFGVETASFVAILAALAFAIGLALQGTLGHFASGVLILMLKYYKTGDYVEIANVEGVVDEIQIFNTILITPDNRQITVPNGLVTSDTMTNYTTLGVRRLDLLYGIDYEDDIDKARSVLLDVIATCDTVMEDRDKQIFVKELGDSSVNFSVRIWTTADDYWATFWEMQEKVKKAFDREGISFPYPQMDVHHNEVKA